MEKNLFVYSSFTFSLDQFYRFTCTIYLYRFYHNVLSFTRAILYVLFSNFTDKIFSTLIVQSYFIANLVIWYNSIVSHLQFFYITFFTTIFIRHTPIYKVSSFIFFIEINLTDTKIKIKKEKSSYANLRNPLPGDQPGVPNS